MAIWRRFAIGVAVVALFGVWASAAEASSGQITSAEATPDWSHGSFAGSVTWTDCGTGCKSWLAVVVDEPSVYTCEAGNWAESDPNIRMVWNSGGRTANGTVPFAVSDYPILSGVYGQRLCLIVVESCYPVIHHIPYPPYAYATCPAGSEPPTSESEGTWIENRLLASTVFKVASPAPPVAPPAVPPATAKPANTALPRITGRAEVGTKLTVSHGSWTGSPTAYKYQWKRCNDKGKNCKALKGATKSSFTPGKKYIGTRLKVAVTASNPAGKTTITSKASNVVSA